jgi:HK97 gp10 family phage protein
LASTVKLTGIEEMKRQLNQLSDKIKKTVLNGAVFAGAKALQSEVVAHAPMRTGNLRNNIITYRDRQPQRIGATVHYSVLVRKIKIARKVKRLLRRAAKAGVELTFADNPFYWKFLEYGTSKMAARPFFRPAIQVVQPQLIKIVGDKLKAGIDRAAKQAGAK